MHIPQLLLHIYRKKGKTKTNTPFQSALMETIKNDTLKKTFNLSIFVDLGLKSN